jgi:hypothetical protein
MEWLSGPAIHGRAFGGSALCADKSRLTHGRAFGSSRQWRDKPCLTHSW